MSGSLKHSKYRIGAVLILCVNIFGCALFDNKPAMMGVVSEGIYTQPQGNFSCPLKDEFLGLHGKPRITDSVRTIKTKEIPLSQRAPSDWRKTKIVSDITHPSRTVKIEDASGTIIEISSGKRIHTMESVLGSGMRGGVSWHFASREIKRARGRMVIGLLLVPWHEENRVYMGLNFAEAYRQGQGPDARLWIRSNIVIAEIVHTVTIKLPVVPLLTQGIYPRDLPAVRDDIRSRPALQEELFLRAGGWLARCNFSEKIK